ncbi:MAG: hypothetical protein MJZ86_10925 [Bacteroidales bacterium]|nr:hypothetical protein [Bacteroidales bacterium]
MKMRIIKLRSSLLAMLLGLWGMSVSGCESCCEKIITMYGTIETEYQENYIVDEMAANVGIVDVGEQI